MLANNLCIIDMIYLDFSKAFDKVDFGRLARAPLESWKYSGLFM